MSCLFCVLKIAEIENSLPVPSKSFRPFQTLSTRCQQLSPWVRNASSWAPPRLCLPCESWGEVMKLVEVVFILCSNRPEWELRSTSWKPQLEDLQVCYLRFTLNIKVWIIIQILRSQNQSPKSFLGKSWSRMWATRFIQIRQSFHGQIPLMKVTSTSNAATGRYLAPIVERCKL